MSSVFGGGSGPNSIDVDSGGGGGSGGGVQSVTAGTNVTITGGDPLNPIVNATDTGVQTVSAGTNITITGGDPRNPVINSTATTGVNSVAVNTASKLSITGTNNVTITNTSPIVVGNFGANGSTPSGGGSTIYPTTGSNTPTRRLFTINRFSLNIAAIIAAGVGYITVYVPMSFSTTSTATGYIVWGIVIDSTGNTPPVTTTTSYTLAGVQGGIPFGAISIPCNELMNFSNLYVYVQNFNISPSVDVTGIAGDMPVFWTPYIPSL
jgi:hypothetical protein